MIRYTLLCSEEHSFESWFRDSDAFDALSGAGQVACPTCGSVSVRKALMAPSLVTSRRKAGRPRSIPGQDVAVSPPAPVPVASDEGRERRATLRELHRRMTAGATDVGRRFANEARAIHEGAAPERAIYGQATHEEVGSLLEDGIPLLPMPPSPDDHH